MDSQILNFQKHFSLDHSYLHFNNAGLCPMPSSTAEAIAECAHDFSKLGAWSFDKYFPVYTECREQLASIVGTQADCTAYMPSCAAAISQVAFGISFKEGDEIVTSDQEYPSNAYPWWHVAQQKNLKFTQVASRDDFSIDEDALVEAINENTKIVALSWIQYQSGASFNVKRVSRKCKQTGALLVLDVIQGLGAIPFNMQEMGVDIVCGGTHKWLCGPTGMGFLAFANTDLLKMTPLNHGAMSYGDYTMLFDKQATLQESALRFEPGTPAIINLVALNESLKLLNYIGIEKIHHYNLELTTQLVTTLKEWGATVLKESDLMPGQSSSIVSFTHNKFSTEDLSKHLIENKVSHGLRAGGIRISVHGFNSIEDIQKLAELLLGYK